MPVRILKHETRCKICVHPKAQEINALLEKRSNREKADDGTRYTLAVVLQILGGWGVINPTEENVKLHVKNHIEFLAAETIEINKAEEQEIIEKINSGEMKMADLDEGMRRARDHVKPYEDASLMKRIGVPSKLAKLLVIFEDASPGRVTVVLVREPVGV